MSLTFEEYQRLAQDTAIYPNVGNNFVYPTLGLAGEAGEVANSVKKFIRDQNTDTPLVGLEIGDVLWYAAQLCTELGLDLQLIAEGNLKRLKDRKERGVLHGSGSGR